MLLKNTIGTAGVGKTVSRGSLAMREGAAVLAVFGVLGCASAEGYLYQPVTEPISKASGGRPADDTITVGVEYSESVPKRVSMNIVESHSASGRYCWLIYADGPDGEYLLNPRSDEKGQSAFIGKVVHGPASTVLESVVGVSETGHGKYQIARGGDGGPEVLFRMREHSRHPGMDEAFSASIGQVCRITDEPKAMLYFDKEIKVVVVPLK